MTDWLDELEPSERRQWDAFVVHARREAFSKIDESALVMHLAPEKWDVKIALELGASIMLDKPLLVVIMPHSQPGKKILEIADMIVEADPDTEEGRIKISEAVREMGEKLSA